MFAASLSILFSLQASADQHRAYAGNFNTDTVSVIDTTNNTVIATITVGEGVGDVEVTPDGTRAYTTNFDSNSVSVIDTTSNTVIATIPGIPAPGGIAFTPDGSRVYVTQCNGGISVIDTTTNAIVNTIAVGVSPCGEMAFAPDGRRLYVGDTASNTVLVIDTMTNTMLATIPVGTFPNEVIFAPDGTRAYVTNFLSSDISIIDATANTVAATISGISHPWGEVLNPDGTLLYVDNFFAGTLTIIDTATNAVVATISGTGGGGLPLGITPDGGRIYIPNDFFGNAVTVVDTARNTVVATIPIAAGSEPDVVTVAPATTTIRSNFNATPIAGNDFVWFSGVLSVQGLGANPVTVFVHNSSLQFTVNGTKYNLPTPNAMITFSPTAGSATTSFDPVGNRWMTTVPSALGGNTFMDGLEFPVPTGGLPGGINSVNWVADFTTDTPGITVNWKWAAAVYTSFSSDYQALGVKPVDDNRESQYQNSDHAGTPENFKPYVIGGAAGGGGANYTGGYSGTARVTF